MASTISQTVAAVAGKTKPLRWGILATGGIAQTFTKDLIIDPATRGVHDVKHEVVAAASSSSAERAAKFLADCGVPAGAKAYGSYKDLVADPNVEIIYVATPHSHHFQNTMLALTAGKHVLCEKAFTVNAAQAKKLSATAKEKGLFLMEAVWTRYFPLSIHIRKMITDGKIGKVHRVIADLSFGADVEKTWGTTHRMTNMDLAGGAMLDLGIYPLTWLFQTLYHLQSEPRQAPKVSSSILKYPATGADENTAIILAFPGSATTPPSHGIATCNFRVDTNPDGNNSAGPAVRIQGTEGEINVFGPAFRPTHIRVIPRVREGHSAPFEVQDIRFPIPGHGMFWEADECARCVREGKLESTTLSQEESIVFMETMDEVRKQNDLVYPANIESTEFPLPGF